MLRTTLKHAAVTVSVTLADKASGQTAEVITSSREHPFFVEGKGFVPAGGLAIGNTIVTRAGPSLVVKEVRWNRRAEGDDVFNFVVEDDHTYFVGNANGGAWVHNPRGCGMNGDPATKAQNADIAKKLSDDGWEITHGGGRGKEECIPDPDVLPTGRRGRPKNGVYPDITATKDGETLRIQTVDTAADGYADSREMDNALKILKRRPNDGLILIPKRRQ